MPAALRHARGELKAGEAPLLRACCPLQSAPARYKPANTVIGSSPRPDHGPGKSGLPGIGGDDHGRLRGCDAAGLAGAQGQDGPACSIRTRLQYLAHEIRWRQDAACDVTACGRRSRMITCARAGGRRRWILILLTVPPSSLCPPSGVPPSRPANGCWRVQATGHRCSCSDCNI
jgi:hypothetical protein